MSPCEATLSGPSGLRRRTAIPGQRIRSVLSGLEPISHSGAEALQIALSTTINRRENHRFGASNIRRLKSPLSEPFWGDTDKKYWTWRDNIFVERFWRSIKYEEIYLHAYDSVAQAKAGIARYIEFFNAARPHSSLDTKTPDEFYFATLPAIKQAA